jgi:hypothetical protein
MKALIAAAAVAITLTTAGTVFANASPNRGINVARLGNVDRPVERAYALTGQTAQAERKSAVQDRHPVLNQIARGRGAF